MIETQESVTAWCDESYPDDLLQKAVNLLEECVELALEVGLTADVVSRAVEISISKSIGGIVGSRTTVKKEIGDVLLSAYNLAGTAGIDAHEALDDVMSVNRARSRDEVSARAARKRQMGLDASEGGEPPVRKMG
jgi:NTP pyrophosphatase (non-canonical NTP hydrolase)